MQIGQRSTSWNSQPSLYKQMLISRAKRQLANDYYQSQHQSLNSAFATARSDQLSAITQLTTRAVTSRLSKSA